MSLFFTISFSIIYFKRIFPRVLIFVDFFSVNSSDVDKIGNFRMKKLLNHGKKENFIKNFTEFEVFCLSEKKLR